MTLKFRLLNKLKQKCRKQALRYSELRCPAITRVFSSEHCYLTFDDGPNPVYTKRIASMLKARGHLATFFFIGSIVSDNKELLREMRADGHAIGSHSSTHTKQWENQYSKVLYDYRLGHEQLEKALEESSGLFRPPYGYHDLSSAKFCMDKGFNPILWTYDSFDWQESATDKEVFKAVYKGLCPGNIILFHDGLFDNPAASGREHTISALEKIMDELEKKGLYSNALSM